MRRHLTSSLLLVVSLLACACFRTPTGKDVDAGDQPLPIAITVEPADQSLVIDNDVAATGTYKAIGTFADGSTADISDRVGFALEDGTLGSFVGADLTSTLDKGGRTRVTATLGGVEGSTGVVLVLRKRYSDPSSTGLPTNPAGPFSGTPDAARAPDVVYPNDGVLLPPNLRILEFHFRPGAGNTLFEIAFENALIDLKIYARCTLPMNGGCIYTVDSKVWQWIAETNRGGEALAVRTRGTDDAGTGVGTSADVTLTFGLEDVKGGIYYWKAGGGANGESAIMRYDFGSVTQTTAERFVGPDQAGGRCVGCHALSRDGTKLVAAAGGWDVEDSLFVDVESATRVATPAKTAFASWNPDGSKYVGVYAFAGTPSHDLMLFDGSTGAQTDVISVGATAARSTSHPDWSADGSSIAFVRAGQAHEGGVNNQRFYQGAVEVVKQQAGGTFGAAQTLVPAQAGKNRYYPAFSPDSKLLAFNESTCPTGTAHIDCNADSDPTATVFVVKPEAGAAPIALARANAPGKTDTRTALTNSWPKWAPFESQRTTTAGSRLVWMTFSSSRNVGLRTPPAGASGESASGTLLWMVAIDPERALAGADPSYPAFALPFQDVTSSNHIAQWTKEIVVLQ
ncbi:MAG: PD40 domain-containing protein [Deltaproteobacteria bacterium]|nr:PD40 domain-containing protein [Deltaproteobacteria bacterium]